MPSSKLFDLVEKRLWLGRWCWFEKRAQVASSICLIPTTLYHRSLHLDRLTFELQIVYQSLVIHRAFNVVIVIVVNIKYVVVGYAITLLHSMLYLYIYTIYYTYTILNYMIYIKILLQDRCHYALVTRPLFFAI